MEHVKVMIQKAANEAAGNGKKYTRKNI